MNQAGRAAVAKAGGAAQDPKGPGSPGADPPPPPPPPPDGTAREAAAAAAGAAAATVLAAAEAEALAAIAIAVTSAVTAVGTTKLLDAALAKAHALAAKVRGIFTKAHPEATDAAAEQAPGVDMHQAPGKPPEAGREAPKVGEDHSPAQVIKQATETAADQAVDVYRQAVTEALDETRGGLPATSTSYSRLQAAQKALDKLTAQGITGYTDKAGQ